MNAIEQAMAILSEYYDTVFISVTAYNCGKTSMEYASSGNAYAVVASAEHALGMLTCEGGSNGEESEAWKEG